MKTLLTTLALSTALLIPLSAHATLQICVAEDGGALDCSGTSATGSLTFSPVLTNFNNITVAASGVPVEVDPDLATTDLNADTITGFTGTHTLDIQIYQTDLSPVSDNLQSTFTVNNLIGTTAFAGPSTLQDFTGGTGTSLGTLLHTDTFGAVAFGGSQMGPDFVDNVTSDAQRFLITFTQGGQSVTDTIQTIGTVNEPTSLALLGAFLIGLYWRSRRRPEPEGNAI